MRPVLLLSQLVLLLLEPASCSITDCYDKSTVCSTAACTKFPEFSRNNCPKMCGLCDSSSFEGLGSRGSSITTSRHSTHSRTSSVMCVDKDMDCSQDICLNYPYTAKERCAKTCGLCADSSSSSTSGTSHSSQRVTPHENCVDEDPNCSQDTCVNYPLTAKHRCAKTCNLCGLVPGSSSSHTFTHHTPSRTGSISSIGDTTSRRGSESTVGKLCMDKDADCTQQTCRDYPFTAKERCAKTCNMCEGSSRQGSSPSSRHSSITDHHSSGSVHSTDTILTRDKEIECLDLDIDCKPNTCKDYPYTAKERCAKTCGFCRKEAKSSMDSAYGGESSRHSSVSGPSGHDTSSSRKTSSASDRRESASSAISQGGSTHHSNCIDKDRNCDDSICMDRPHTAKDKCAKTCGFCDSGSSGPKLSLRSESIDREDDGSLITLDGDDTGNRGRTSPTALPESRRPSVDTSRRGSIASGSSGSIRSQHTTYVPPTRTKQSRTRTGPCADQNRHCENADCQKYPRFSERYCEKTCGFC